MSCIHITNAKICDANVGDAWCSPLHFFDFGLSTLRSIFDVNKIRKDDPQLVIIGGGGLIGQADDKIRELILSRDVVLWGVGINKHYTNKTPCEKSGDFPGPYPEGIWDAKLVGLRDYVPPEEEHRYNSKRQYLPCVSCMSPLFDTYSKIKPTKKMVAFEHGDNPIQERKIFQLPDTPFAYNMHPSLETTLQHLASGEFVLTNSYHGIYWAQLLGRIPLVFRPFSSRFEYFKNKPKVVRTHREIWEATEEDPEDKTFDPKEFLEECRSLNREFYTQVKELVCIRN